MGDDYGALQSPAEAPPTADSPVADPALEKISAYLTAVINAELIMAWNAVNPGNKPVVFTDTNDPKDSTFNERQLPALFVYRGTSTLSRMADDWYSDHSQVTVLWVPPNADQFKRSLRSSFINGVIKTIDRAIALGRHPAWVDVGDANPDTLLRGSEIGLRAGLVGLECVKTGQPTTLIISVDGDATRSRNYTGVLVQLQIVEVLAFEPENYVGAATPAALLADVTDSTGATTVEIQRPI